jgi:hypothetical protein
MGKVKKTISKLIPNEAKPFLPYLAAMIPGGSLGIGAFAASNPLAYKALIAGATKGLTDDDAKLKDIARTSAFAVAPDLISEGLGTVSQKYGAAGDSAGTFKDTGVLSKIADYAGTAKQAIDSSPYYTLGAQTGADATVKQIELNAEALEKYNADLLAQGIGDKAARRSAIFKIFQNSGYDDDEVNTMLDKYSYAGGGRVGFMNGGIMNAMRGSVQYPGGYAGEGTEYLSPTDSNEGGMGGVMYSDEKGNPITKEQAMELFNKQAEEENKIKDFLNVKRKENEPKFEYNLKDFDIKRTPPKVVIMNENGETQIIDEDLAKKLNANIIMNSFDTEAIIRQEAKAKGGIIGLMNGGQPMEMDYRMGGMIPIGSKERADDVPARLSKNEFVMTADAVRAAGGGSVNEGARRMYELMNNLEAKV